MWKRVAVTVCLLAVPVWLGAQVSATDRTVTVTASRTASTAPDQAVFSVDVLTPMDASRDDVLGALQGSGLTAANLVSLYTSTQFVGTGASVKNMLDWSFSLTAPLANLKATIDQLTALQLSVAKKNAGMTISFGLRGTQASSQALAGVNCAAADLIGDARTQAQKLAVAAGLSVGSVVAVSGTSVVTPPTGGFSAGTYQPSCTLTVKFALTGL